MMSTVKLVFQQFYFQELGSEFIIFFTRDLLFLPDTGYIQIYASSFHRLHSSVAERWSRKPDVLGSTPNGGSIRRLYFFLFKHVIKDDCFNF